MNLLATRHRVSPAIIGGQVGDNHLQTAVVRIAATHRYTHIVLALQRANRRPHGTTVA